ncbi:thioesterase family protein [Pseudogracilibacillus sp. SE30717A]|uniref:acyl-CoA thioesterase n=1 Tax=Pseudogracilibacillus sp. SE30717A TaxID=3098293 RepID=UPI00300E598A
MKSNVTEIDVRYAETDQMGVVHHANYLVWFEVGRTNFIKQIGLNYAEMEAGEVVSPVVDVELSYKKPAKYGDTVLIKTWLEKYDGVRTTYGYHVLDANENILVTGSTVHVVVNKHTFRPVLLRKTHPEWHAIYMSLVNEGK